MNKYKSNTHHRCDEEFFEGDNFHERISESEHYYLYQVTVPSGTNYYELVKRGNIYRQVEGRFSNGNLNDGDEMYPINEEFGKWGWCYMKKEAALNSFERANRIAELRRK